MASQSLRFLAGWPLVGVLSVVLCLMSAAIAAAHAFDVEGVRTVIRATARTSFVLFCLAFVAAPLYRLRPNGATQWLRRNRRYLGVSFAVSHLLHAIAILAFAWMDPATFQQGRTVASYILGGLGYALILTMAATSFDASAAWVGRRAWGVLHRTGVYYLWVIFLLSYGTRSVQHASYRVFVAVLFAVMAIRVIGWWRGRSASGAKIGAAASAEQ